jgi:hypothetical protein
VYKTPNTAGGASDRSPCYLPPSSIGILPAVAVSLISLSAVSPWGFGTQEEGEDLSTICIYLQAVVLVSPAPALEGE